MQKQVSLLDFDVEIWAFKPAPEQMHRFFAEWDKVNNCK
jgi:hypothetical protein